MSSINLIKQIKSRKSASKSSGAQGLGGGGLKGLFGNLSTTSMQLTSKEKVLLGLFGLGMLSIFGTRTYLSDFYFPAQEESVRTEMAQLDNDLAQIKVKLSSYDSIKSDIDSFERKMAEVREKLSVIESVQKGRNAIVRMVDFVISEMPDAIWLSQVKIETFLDKLNPALPPPTTGSNPLAQAPQSTTLPQPGAGEQAIGQVGIKGSALNLQLVSEFMKRLEGAVFFPKWNLIETREEAGGGMLGGSGMSGGGRPGSSVPTESKSFEITAKVVGLP